MLVLLSGVSGAGKDTIKRELIKKMENVVSLPSYTDRPMRTGDIPGETYNFVTTEEFETMISNNELYEYDVHHGKYYGTSKVLMSQKIKSGKIIVKDIDVNGVENLVKILKQDVKVITIFLRVPKEVLRKRLESREDKLSEEEINLRLSRYEYEESKSRMYDYVIKNNNFEKTMNIIGHIIENEYKTKEAEF